MTLQPPRTPAQPGTAGCAHLTGEQFGELLARSARSPEPSDALAEAHLRTCEQCAAELATLRESLTLFREAGSAYADRQLRLLPRWRIPARPQGVQPAYFAAAAILLLSVIPMQMAHRQSRLSRPAVAAGASAVVAAGNQARTAESDAALLEDVNSEASASVPTPMQALDVPDDPIVATATEPAATPDQRKD
jgi:anti-sigma factor RsiW